jgi:hypothetical protein
MIDGTRVPPYSAGNALTVALMTPSVSTITRSVLESKAMPASRRPALVHCIGCVRQLSLAKLQLCASMEPFGEAECLSRFPLGVSGMEYDVSEALHPSAPHGLPGFITAPGDTDILMVVVGIVLIAAVLGVGNLYLHLHTLPERMAHKSQKLQFEIVAVLGLLALFTHNHLFWVIGLFLAMIDLPDFGTPLGRIAGSVEKIAGVPPGDEAAEMAGEGAAHAAAAEAPDATKAGAAKSEVASHA